MLLVFFRAMKKYLPALAALALAGCAHSQYRTTYLEEYAGYDCIELRAERLAVEEELDPRWRQGYSSRNGEPAVLYFASAGAGPGFGMPDLSWPPQDDYDPTRPRPHKKRMRNHAKWQALVQLEQKNGCDMQ